MVKPGDGMPLRRDISFTCTCPDDGNWDGYACKHVVATLFTLSDELLLEPDLLDLWRGRTEPHDPEDDRTDDTDDTDDTDEPVDDVEIEDAHWRRGRERRHLRLVGGRDDRSAPPVRVTPPSDPLADLLRLPDGTALPDVGDIERIEPQLPKSRELASVLRDALGNLRIDWD
jgi:hypothetical protein